MSDTKNSEQNTTTSWRDKTVKAAGYGYLIGDAAGIVATCVQPDFKASWATAGGFATWAAGGLAAAVYGNPSIEKQLEILGHKLEAHLKKEGAVINEQTRENTELLRGRDGIGAKLDRFMHTHPTEMLNAAYAVGAAGLLRDGIKDFANKKTIAAMGALVLAGALGGLLIKEDPEAQSKVDQNSITSRVMGYIKEKPMRLTGALYWANNGVGLAKALAEKKKFALKPGIKPHWFSFLMVSAYVASNGLLSLSSRDQIEEKKFRSEDIAKLEDVAAQIIAAQPPQLQAALLTDVSRYLAKEKMIDVSAEELSKQLIARVSESSKQHLAQATKADWATRATQQPTSQAVGHGA